MTPHGKYKSKSRTKLPSYSTLQDFEELQCLFKDFFQEAKHGYLDLPAYIPVTKIRSIT